MKERGTIHLPDGSKKRVLEADVADKLLKEKEPQGLEQLADTLGVGVDIVQATVEGLRKEGYGFQIDGDVVIRTKAVRGGEVYDHRHLYEPPILRAGLVADTHTSSKKERLDILNALYDRFQIEGISVVYHIGDFTEGVGVYRGQELEIKHHGQQEQIEYAIAEYPRRPGIKTYFITGNHDTRAYERGGVDPGVAIASQRDDLIYLGQIDAKVLMSNGVLAEMLHPGGGIAYALSYKAQKDINNRPPNELPNTLWYGHYHGAFYMFYRGIHFLQIPCTKEAGLWEKRLGINPVMGGWIIEAHLNSDEKIERFKPELFKFK